MLKKMSTNKKNLQGWGIFTTFAVAPWISLLEATHGVSVHTRQYGSSLYPATCGVVVCVGFVGPCN